MDSQNEKSIDGNPQGSLTTNLSELYAGRDLSGVKMPEDFIGFSESLRFVEEASKNCRKTLLILLMVCAYSTLTIVTTTDLHLISNLHSSPLPIMGSQIQIVFFFMSAPLLLLGLYIYFHLCLQRLWDELSTLPAVFPDGRTLDQAIYPWLLTGYIRSQFSLLREKRPPYSRFQSALAISIAWWIVPLTIGIIWWTYLTRHDWLGTSWHIFLLVVSFTCLIHFQCSARTTLRSKIKEEAVARRKKLFRYIETLGSYSQGLITHRIKCWAVILTFTAVFVLASFGAIDSIQTANITGAVVSTRPENWTIEGKIDAVNGANLRYKNLNKANAEKTFLVKADLTGAKLQNSILKNADLRRTVFQSAILQNADLENTDLREADLTSAKLEGAILLSAKLQKAKLTSTYLNNANLVRAKLQGANLMETDLRGADLSIAELENANLTSAKLQEADLLGADLTEACLAEANLIGTKHISIKQLSKVKTLYGAKMEPHLLVKIKKDHQDLLQPVRCETP